MQAALVSYDCSDESDSEENFKERNYVHDSVSASSVSKQIITDDEEVVVSLISEIICAICGYDNSIVCNDDVQDEKPSFRLDTTGYRNMLSNVVPSDSDSNNECSTSTVNSGSDDDLSHKATGHCNSEDSDYVFSRVVNESRRRKGEKSKPSVPPRTKGELSINDLPKIEKLQISLPESTRLQRLGCVASVVDTLVIVLSDYNVPALDEDTMLFTEDRNSFGKVFEIFGAVSRPYYSIRFNNAADALASTARPSLPIYFAPDLLEYTRPVFTDALRQMGKGSDASWMDNNEPPAEALDYSDDEQERRAKAERRKSKLKASNAVSNGVKVGGDDDDGGFDADSDDEVDVSSSDSTRRPPPLAVRQTVRGRRRRGRKTGVRGEIVAEVAGEQTNFNSPATSERCAPSVDSIRTPWWAGRRGGASSQASSSASNDWMWMSEQKFRFPAPRFPTRFVQPRSINRTNLPSLMAVDRPMPASFQAPMSYHSAVPVSRPSYAHSISYQANSLPPMFNNVQMQSNFAPIRPLMPHIRPDAINPFAVTANQREANRFSTNQRPSFLINAPQRPPFFPHPYFEPNVSGRFTSHS